MREIGLLVVALFCLVFTFLAVSDPQQAQLDNDLVAEHRAQHYSDKADEEIWRLCSDVAVPERTKCGEQVAEPYRQAERGERDLQAQQTMAIWTRAMGMTAIIGMGIGIFSLYLIFTTFRETRRAASAGIEANRIAQRLQRAWITLKARPLLVQLKGIDGLYLRLEIEAENTGGSVATHFEINTQVFFIGDDGNSEVIGKRMTEQVEAWKSEHVSGEISVLMPRDREVDSMWDSFPAKEVHWRSQFGTESVCYPMILAAVFYRTTSDPQMVQLSWRSWYLHSYNEEGEVVSWLPKPPLNGLSRNILCAEPHRMNLTHEEYPAKKSEDGDG